MYYSHGCGGGGGGGDGDGGRGGSGEVPLRTHIYTHPAEVSWLVLDSWKMF